jgi:BlaR1 peptidase M56/Secretion system C-terminal sorting domain/Gram-negative bacterial TonB protein C-terminal
MKSLLYYLLQVIVASGILYGYYHLALRNKKFHHYNRFYLLIATVISIIIPFLNIPVYFSSSETDSSFILQTLTVISSGSEEVPTVTIVPETHINWFSWENLSFLFYILIASLVLIRIIFSLVKIRRIINTNPVEQLDQIHFVNTEEPGTPFSFFRWLFWNNKIELQSEKGEQIFRHELFHIKQKHSWDIMYLELLTVLLWINPFFHLIKKEVKAIHEFLADQFAVKENKHWEYAELLLMQVLNTKQQLVNPFFHNQIKRRIAMITTSKKPSHQYFRKLMVLPIAAIVIGLFAFSYKEKKKTDEDEKKNLLISEQINLADTTQNPSVNKITWIEYFNPSVKKSPTSEKVKMWSDSKTYRVWLDNKRIMNAELSKYKPSDFAIYNVVKLENNAPNYGNSFYRVNLWTKEWYEKSQKNKASDTGKKYLIVKDTTKPLLENRFEKTLIVIDGVIRDDISTTNFNDKVNTNDLESITILKDESAIEKYGTKGKNGVIEIITKKNSNNYDLQLEYVKEDNIIVFSKVEIDPSFPGGDAKWKQYLKAVLNQNIPAQKGATVGTYTVIVQFIVKTDSFLTNIKPLTNHGFGMEEEAIRIISKGPRWIPALQNGKQVNAIRKQPVTFVVEGNDKTSQINSSYLNEVVVAGYLKDKGRYTNLPKNAIVPLFVGVETEWRKHLERNLNPTAPIDNGAPAGTYTTVTQFLVKADGNTSEFKSLTNHGYGMEEEALRVIQSAKQWEPAIVNGEKVNTYKRQPITFQIITDGSDVRILTNPNADQLFSIYPNPSNNFVVIPFNSQLAEKGEIRITDINGNSKMTIPASFAKGVNNLSINVASLAKGMYIVNVINASKKNLSTYKMVKQ